MERLRQILLKEVPQWGGILDHVAARGGPIGKYRKIVTTIKATGTDK